MKSFHPAAAAARRALQNSPTARRWTYLKSLQLRGTTERVTCPGRSTFARFSFRTAERHRAAYRWH